MPKALSAKTERHILLISICIAIVGSMGIDIHLASLPTMTELMHTDKEHMHQSISIYVLGMGLSMLIYGPLSDRYGRKPIILFGLVLGGLSCFASLFTHSIDLFLLTRLVQGLGAGVCIGIDRTMLGDVWEGDQLAIIASRFILVVALAPIFGPVLGGYLQQYFDWQATFMVLGSLLFVMAFIFACFCPETNHLRDRKILHVKSIVFEYRSLLSSRIFMISLLLGGVGASIEMVYATLSPFILQNEFHLDPVSYGWFAVFLGVGAFLARYLVAPLIKKFGRKGELKICVTLFLLMSILFVILGFGPGVSLILLFTIMLVITFSETGMNPIFSTYALGDFPRDKGIGDSLFGSLQMLVSFALTALAGSFSEKGMLVLSLSYLFMALMIFLLTHFLTSRLTA